MLAAPRPGQDKILAFYEHRVGAICKDVPLLLIPLDDHLCHRGDGAFESISYREGKLLQLEAHLKRMQSSAAGLNMTPPCSWDEVRHIIMQVAKASAELNGAIRILLGRGPGGFGISARECPNTSLYVVAIKSHVPSEDWYNKGLTALASNIPAKQGYLAKLKNTNYLPNVLMDAEAQKLNVDVTFSFNEQGYLAEAAVANVAIVTADNVLASPFFEQVLPGTTLCAALEYAKEFMPTQFCNITRDDILTAKEVLLFGSTPLCVGVTHFEGKAIGLDEFAAGKVGPLAHKLRAGLLMRLLAEGTEFLS